jgi:peptide/nickel transport system substrate-binding protein
MGSLDVRLATRYKLTMTRGASLVMAASMCLIVSACGSSHRATSTRGGAVTPAAALNGQHEALAGGKRGGTLTVYDHVDFQTLDPGEQYAAVDYEVGIATQRALYSYKPNQTAVLSPDLASGPATVSADGRTVTVHIRAGVHFSPPINREATSADVAYAIERGANPNVANGYFSTYFGYLVGAAKANGGPIPGIVTPDRYTIVFHLTGSYGTFFSSALSLPLTAPVPPEFAKPLDSKKPTQYGNKYLVATGPYMVQTDAKGRFLGIGYQPGKSATLVRNPNWNAKTDTRPAYLDRININIGGDPAVIGRQVLYGSHSIQNDTPAGAIVKLADQHYHDQLVAVPDAGIYYIAVNNHKGPFSNINVRKALWAALDREAMIRAGGGVLTGQLGTHFIYPGADGYQQAGGDAGPRVDYNSFPTGNMALAIRYMKAGGYPTGRYTGAHRLKVIGATGEPYAPVAEIVDQTLQRLGFKTNFVLVDQSVMFGKFCTVPAQEIDVCPNAGWTRDFADPQTNLDPLFAGYNIVSTGSSNIGQVDVPQINTAMRAAERIVGASARAEAWAAIDRMLVENAVAIPWEFIKNPTIESRDVRGVNALWNAGYWDYSYTSLK